MRAVCFIGKFQLLLNYYNYANPISKSRTSQTRKTLAETILGHTTIAKCGQTNTKRLCGQSPLAMLQQNKRDETRIFFNQRNHHFYFALTRKQPDTKTTNTRTMRIKQKTHIRIHKTILLLFKSKSVDRGQVQTI